MLPVRETGRVHKFDECFSLCVRIRIPTCELENSLFELSSMRCGFKRLLTSDFRELSARSRAFFSKMFVRSFSSFYSSPSKPGKRVRTGIWSLDRGGRMDSRERKRFSTPMLSVFQNIHSQHAFKAFKEKCKARPRFRKAPKHRLSMSS